MGERHSALNMVYNYWLCVGPVIAARCTVAHMADSHIPLSKLLHNRRCKNVVYKPYVLMEGKQAVVVYNDTAAFLASVLERK